MERVALDIDACHLLVADFDPLGVNAAVEFASYDQTGLGRGGGHQFHHREPTGQRSAAPSLGDMAEHPMLSSRPGEFHPQALLGRVEDWRAGRPWYSRPFHVSSPLYVARNVRISRIARPHLLHAEAYGTYPAGATFGPSRRTR